MTVYNRKMFRKKGGGVNGIMASGPELIKANLGFYNAPGGGASALRGGFPNISAFSAFEPPKPITKINNAISLSPTGSNFQSGTIDIFGKDRTRFGKEAVAQMSRLEDLVGTSVKGPMPLKSGVVANIETASEKFAEKDDKPTRSDAYAAGFRELGPGINQSIVNINEMTGVDQYDDLNTDFDIQKKTDENENKTVYEQSSDTNVDNTAATVDLSGESVQKGSGKEEKGGGKANTTPNSEMGTKYKSLAQSMLKQMQSGKIDNATDNSLITHGYDKDTVKEMTEEEKIIEMKAMLSKFGQNTEETEDLSGLNIMMLGLSIAAGDSPDALTNIAKGAKEFVGQRAKEIKQKIKDRKDKEDAMDLLAIKTVLGRTDKKEDREFQSKEADKSRAHDMKKISTMNANDMVKLGMTFDFKKMIADNANNLQIFLKDKDIASRYDLKKLDVEMFNASAKNSFKQLTMKLNSAEMIARNTQLGNDKRAEAALEAQNLRAVISNFDKGYGFAFYQGAKDGLEGEDLAKYVEENGKRFASNSLLTGPDSIRRMIIKNAGTVMKEQNVDFDEAADIILKTITTNPELRVFFKKDLTQLGLNVDIKDENKNTNTSGITVKKIN